MAHLERYESAKAVEENRNRIALAENARIKAEQNLIESEAQRLESARIKRDLKIKTLGEYRTFIKDTLLKYIIEELMEDAIDAKNMNEHDIQLCHHFSETFIKESGGAGNILLKAMGRTPLIEEITNAVEDSTKIIYDKADKENPGNLEIDKNDIVDCINKLNKSEDFQTAKEKIAQKVKSAEEEFVANQTYNKAAIDNIIGDTEQKMHATDIDYDMNKETKDAIKQEAAINAKRKLKYIQENKARGVFEEMARRYSSSVMKSDILKEHYTDENGRLLNENIISSVRCMYAILETFSTTRLEKIDEAYIKNMLAEL